jgi:hypothetical protein
MRKKAARGHKKSKYKCAMSPNKHPCIGCKATAMEPVHTLQRLDQKRLDEVNRVRRALEAEEYPLIEAEKDAIAECAKELDHD